jgi:hypothetical protein
MSYIDIIEISYIYFLKTIKQWEQRKVIQDENL